MTLKVHLTPLSKVLLEEKCPTTMKRMGEGSLAGKRIEENWKEIVAAHKLV